MLASRSSMAMRCQRLPVGARMTTSGRRSLTCVATYQPGGPAHQPVGTPIVGAPQPRSPPRMPTGGPSTPPQPDPAGDAFASVELAIQRNFNPEQPGNRNDWHEIEGAWVLYPPSSRPPEAVVHFVGGAFVGAAPQIAYRLFLEALANRNILVICTPFPTNFDHLRIADECQFKFDRAMRALQPDASNLPVYGVGHALGCNIHLLISSRYAVPRSGNIMVGYNNRPATEMIPFLSPFIAPSARLMGPLLNQIMSSPVRATAESAVEALRGLSPSIVRQVAPLMEQLAPMFLDVAQGRLEFSPTADEAANLVGSYYTVNRNLLLRFKDDGVDQTNQLAQMLQGSKAISNSVDLSVRTLPGDHLRPMQQAMVDLPPDLARMANQAVYTGGDMIYNMANAAGQFGVPQATEPLQEVSKTVRGMAGVFGGEVGGPVTDSMQSLADEVCAWIGSGNVVNSGVRSLPASNITNGSPYSSRFGSSPSWEPPSSFNTL